MDQGMITNLLLTAITVLLVDVPKIKTRLNRVEEFLKDKMQFDSKH